MTCSFRLENDHSNSDMHYTPTKRNGIIAFVFSLGVSKNIFLLIISEIVVEWLAGYPVGTLFVCMNSLNSHKHSEWFLSLFSR